MENNDNTSLIVLLQGSTINVFEVLRGTYLGIRVDIVKWLNLYLEPFCMPGTNPKVKHILSHLILTI